ncbi:hypothetical protein F52700_2864 [Fusarium sp. NRRL 52700]|nr:hypothetical protein F52700_2864 [Fusarium sp. NRRL 52700]
MECVLEAASALWSPVTALANPCRGTSLNPNGVTPVVQAQELASNPELLSLSYRVQAAPEVHDDATIEANFRRTVLAHARECHKADVFVAVLERLSAVFETPGNGEDRRKKAKLPPMELPDNVIDDMNRLSPQGNPASQCMAWPILPVHLSNHEP